MHISTWNSARVAQHEWTPTSLCIQRVWWLERIPWPSLIPKSLATKRAASQLHEEELRGRKKYNIDAILRNFEIEYLGVLLSSKIYFLLWPLRPENLAIVLLQRPWKLLRLGFLWAVIHRSLSHMVGAYLTILAIFIQHIRKYCFYYVIIIWLNCSYIYPCILYSIVEIWSHTLT